MKDQIRLTAVMLAAGLLFIGGCSEKGPAEKAGARVDEAVESVKEKLDPAGPAEKAGREIDEAVDKVTKDD